MKSLLPVTVFIVSHLLLSTTLGFSQTVISKMDMSSGRSMPNDKPIADYQIKLLDLAFETATDIPVVPHIKDRSRAQEKVVGVSLKLDQPVKALKYIEKIDDWRRGSGYGELAIYHVINGRNDVERYITLAKQIAEASEDWRRDTIKVKIAKAYALLGEGEKAETFEKGLVDFESGKVAGVKAKLADVRSFKEQFKALEVLLKTENFDVIKNALEAYTELYDSSYGIKKNREKVYRKVKSSWAKMPMVVRIDILSRMASAALRNNDQAAALKLVNEAQEIIDGHSWPLEGFIPLSAELIKLRYKSGDVQKAMTDAQAVFSKFESEKETIVDIFRAQALTPLAEAFVVMGNQTFAMKVYKQALEESVINPNSRPRAEDMTAILSSMAQYSVEPDEALWNRIKEVKASLGNPW